MSVWAMNRAMTAQEEEALAAQTFLPLPLGDMPDLSMVPNQQACRHLMGALYPDEPPESIARRVDQVWKLKEIHEEDVILVPLRHAREAAVAEVTGKYEYRVGDDGGDMHSVPVKWHAKRIPFRAFHKHRELISSDALPMQEVGEQEARTIIRDRMPHPWNRFVWLKWLIVVVTLIHAAMFFMRMYMQTRGMAQP